MVRWQIEYSTQNEKHTQAIATRIRLKYCKLRRFRCVVFVRYPNRKDSVNLGPDFRSGKAIL